MSLVYLDSPHIGLMRSRCSARGYIVSHINARLRRGLTVATALLTFLGAGAIAASVANATTPAQVKPTGYLVSGHILHIGDAPLSLPASSINPFATGTATVRVVPGTELAKAKGSARFGTKFANAVIVVSGGSLRPEPAIGARPSIVRPDSASGCTPYWNLYSTCISVTGSGLTLNAWETDAFYWGVNNNCNAQFIVSGFVWEDDFWGCGNGPGRYADWMPLGVPLNLPNNTQVCNYWPGSAGGEPCENVHS